MRSVSIEAKKLIGTAIKETGINTIRVHYPMDEDILDIMDELGLLLIEEVPLNWWGWEALKKLPDAHDHKKLFSQALNVLVKMVKKHNDHPCIIDYDFLRLSAPRPSRAEPNNQAAAGIGTSLGVHFAKMVKVEVDWSLLQLTPLIESE